MDTTGMLIIGIIFVIGLGFVVMLLTSEKREGEVKSKMIGPEGQFFMEINNEIYSVYPWAYFSFKAGDKVSFTVSTVSLFSFLGIKTAGGKFARNIRVFK